jgi:hypothetical protein
MRNLYRIFVGRPKRRWKDNIRMDLREIGWKLWTGFIWIRIGVNEHGNETLGSIKGKEFDWLSEYWLPKEGSVPCN